MHRWLLILMVVAACVAIVPPVTGQVGPMASPEAASTAQDASMQPVSGDRPLGSPRPMQESQPLGTGRESAGASGPGWVRVMAALAGTIVLAIGAAAAFKRFSGAGSSLSSPARAPSGVIEVLGRYPLAPRQNLLLIKLDRRVLLLSQAVGGRGHAAGLTTLTEIVDPEEVASILLKTRDDEGDSIAAKFREAMEQQHAAHDQYAEIEDLQPRVGRLVETA